MPCKLQGVSQHIRCLCDVRYEYYDCCTPQAALPAETMMRSCWDHVEIRPSVRCKLQVSNRSTVLLRHTRQPRPHHPRWWRKQEQNDSKQSHKTTYCCCCCCCACVRMHIHACRFAGRCAPVHCRHVTVNGTIPMLRVVHSCWCCCCSLLLCLFFLVPTTYAALSYISSSSYMYRRCL